MAEAIVSISLAKIAKLLRADSGRISGVEDQISSVQDKLQRMQSLLVDADYKALENERIKDFVLAMKDVAYDAEDLIEWYYVNSSRSGSILKRYASVLKRCYFSSKMSSEIGILQKTILGVEEMCARYEINELIKDVNEASSSSRHQLLMRGDHFFKEEDVIGIENGVDELVGALLSKEYRAVSIWGVAGLGKTTLARKVYHHPDVRRYFDGFAWLNASQIRGRKHLLQRIFISLASEKIGKVGQWTKAQLVLQLGILLNDKRCLIVLDDIRSAEACMGLEAILPKHVKILLTTRSEEVAECMSPNGFTCKPKLLAESEMLELLIRRVGTAFEEGMERMDIEELQRKMVKFCGGVPLAIVVMGGMLSTRPFSEWMTVFHDIQHFLANEDSYGGRALYWILTLSYNDLPSQLQQCFLYLGCFPEDTEIKAETLYQLWIAEGFVSSIDSNQEDESLMELAERYLVELAFRGMVQLQISDEPMMVTKYKSCWLHDLVRDLCLLKAREEAFLNIFGSNPADIPSTSASRRTVIDFSPGQDMKECLVSLRKQTTRELRMLRIVPDHHQQGHGPSSATTIGSLFDNIVVLRVLSLEGLRFSGAGGLPKAIGKLLLLRYLSLKDSCFATLPTSLSNLKHLQTLDLRVLTLWTLPDILWKMEGLTFLYLPSLSKLGHKSFKLRLHGLSNLELLENFHDRVCDPDDLPKLTKLRVLFAECSEVQSLEKISNYVCSNKDLRHVSISTNCDFSSNMEKGLTILQQSFFGSNNIRCFYSRGVISSFPTCETASIPSSLAQLTLNLFGLKEDHDVMGTLEKLINLRSLSLLGYQGTEMTFHANGFPELRILRLFSFSKMKKWVVEEKAMPNLSVLSIWGFPVLEMIPHGLASITTLKELDIKNMPEKFKAGIRTEHGAEFGKIRHVPSVLYS